MRDLQLYAQFDTNFDGGIDEDELHDALQQLNIKTSKEQTKSIFKAATGGSGVAATVTGAVAASVDSLSMQVFTSKRSLEKPREAFGVRDATPHHTKLPRCYPAAPPASWRRALCT